jgi:hypothetical protein
MIYLYLSLMLIAVCCAKADEVITKTEVIGTNSWVVAATLIDYGKCPLCGNAYTNSDKEYPFFKPKTVMKDLKISANKKDIFVPIQLFLIAQI